MDTNTLLLIVIAANTLLALASAVSIASRLGRTGTTGWLRTLPSRIRSGVRYLHLNEPARLKAGYVAACSLAVTLGITLPAGLDGWFEKGLVVLSVLVPIVQGEATRKAVYSPASAYDLHVAEPPTGTGSDDLTEH